MLRVLSNSDWAWLAHQCTFDEEIAWVSITQFYVIKSFYQMQMFIDIVKFKSEEILFII